MKAKVLVKRGQHAGQTFEVSAGRSVTIGRDPSCDLQFFDKGLSRNHSKIAVEEGQFVVSDMGSTNGTFVNGKMVIRKQLVRGDIVRIGKIELQFFPEGESALTSSSIRMVEDFADDTKHTIAQRMGIDSVTITGVDSVSKDDTEEVETLQRALRTIYDLSKILNKVQSAEELYQALTDRVAQLVRAERVFIIRETQGILEPAHSFSVRGETEFQVSKTVIRKTIDERISILSQNAMMDDRFQEGQSIIMNQIKSVMSVPLESQDHVFGAIYVDSQGVGNVFDQAGLQLLSVIGQQAGSALERLQLTAHFIEKQKIEQSLEVAQGIQKKFMPTTFPRRQGIDLVGFSEACDETGGDYYDVLPFDERWIGLAVGDVSGHGVGAALLMATARAFLKAIATAEMPPGEVMNRLNRLLEVDLEDDQFMTFFYGVLDLKTNEIRYSSAGHEPPLIYRAASDEFDALDSTGVPLGMLADFDFEEGPVTSFDSGDVIFLSTDGIMESMNAESEEFGRERMKTALRDSASLSANQVVQTIYERTKVFSGGLPPRDDLTILVVKFVHQNSTDTAVGLDETSDSSLDQTVDES